MSDIQWKPNMTSADEALSINWEDRILCGQGVLTLIEKWVCATIHIHAPTSSVLCSRPQGDAIYIHDPLFLISVATCWPFNHQEVKLNFWCLLQLSHLTQWVLFWLSPSFTFPLSVSHKILKMPSPITFLKKNSCGFCYKYIHSSWQDTKRVLKKKLSM